MENTRAHLYKLINAPKGVSYGEFYDAYVGKQNDGLVFYDVFNLVPLQQFEKDKYLLQKILRLMSYDDVMIFAIQLENWDPSESMRDKRIANIIKKSIIDIREF